MLLEVVGFFFFFNIYSQSELSRFFIVIPQPLYSVVSFLLAFSRLFVSADRLNKLN